MVEEVDVMVAGAVDAAVFSAREKPVEAPVLAAAVLIAGAAPRGFRDRLEGAMDAELITGATEAIDEPSVNPVAGVEAIGAANREDTGAVRD